MTDDQLRQLLQDVRYLKDRQDLSHARPLQLDSPSLRWDGKTP